MDKKPNNWLGEFANNVYSQHGEDGIIEQILELIDNKDLWCVEFGAWDGIFLSNTANLIRNHGYSAVLIEPDPTRFEDIQKNFPDREKVIPLQVFVGVDTHDSLDAILKDTPVPRDFDLLSVDIDGNDYHVWNAVKDYQPKIVIIEFNPTIPNAVDFIQPCDGHVSQGSSAKSITELAKTKGYELIASTHTNLFFVDAQYYPDFAINDNSLDRIHLDDSAVTYIFNGMDGTVFTRGRGWLLWWPIPYHNATFQPLPKRLRKPFHLLTRRERVLAKLYISVYNNRVFLRAIRRVFRAFGRKW